MPMSLPLQTILPAAFTLNDKPLAYNENGIVLYPAPDQA